MAQASLYFRNFIFGVEDSLVSTVGLLSGVAMGGVSREVILLSGVVLILVEAFSMATGSFLTESSVREFDGQTKESRGAILGGMVMFVSYVVSGFFPLAPYVFIDGIMALYVSVGVSLLALFVLGAVSGSLSGGNIFGRGMRMLVIGGAAVLVGVAAGLVLGV